MIAELKAKIEAKFEHLAYFFYDHHMKIIPPVILVVLLSALNLFNYKFDVSTEGFLEPNDPNRVAYTQYRNQYGRDERVIVALKTDNLYDKAFLEQLHNLHEDIENKTPHIKEVTSLLNARKTTGKDDALIVEDLFESFPISDEDIAKAKAYVEQSHFYKNLIVSEDGKFTTIVIRSNTYSDIGVESKPKASAEDEFGEFDDFGEAPKVEDNRPFITDSENSEMVDAIQAIVAEYRAKGLEIYVVGMPAFTDTLKSELLWSMLTFVGLLIASIVFLLFRFFRRKAGVILPMMTVAFSVVTTVSTMFLFDIPLTNMSAILPSFILSVGIGASVHVLGIYFKELDHTKDSRASIGYALSHSGLAIVLTTLTTAGSLLSFATSKVPPIANLGLFAALGATIALFMTIVFIPAMIAKLHVAPKDEHIQTHQKMDTFLSSIAKFASRRAGAIVAVSLLLFVGSFYLASQLHYKHDPLSWLPNDNALKVGTSVIDKELKGSASLEITLDTGVENGVYEPKLLESIEAMSDEIATFKSEHYYIGKTVSVVDIIKEINQALHEGDAKYYTIPQDKSLVAQEFLLFENSGSDDLETMVDTQFSKTHISIKLPWIDATNYMTLLKDVEKSVHTHLDSYGSAVVTGLVPMMVRTVNNTINSTIDSYIVAYGFITILMILLLGSLGLGLLSMIPNIVPVAFGLSAMWLFGMNLDLFTILIGAIAIGLAVDDTIHFMHNFQRYYNEHGNVDKAIETTLLGTGRAMLMTSVILTIGFFVYIFSQMQNISNFGIITGTVIIVALLADFLFAPALLKLIIKDKEIK